MGINNTFRTLTANNIEGVASTRNYVPSSFENNTLNGYSLGTIGTLVNGLPTGTPTFGSGANANLGLSVTASNALSETYSLAYISAAATTQGDMFASPAFTIDIKDQAKVLGYSFCYKLVTGGTNVNLSGTSSNSLAVAFYDITNSVFIPVIGAFNLIQGTGVGIASGTFQTNANTLSGRFIVYNANATAGSCTLYFDDFYVGPQSSDSGSRLIATSVGLTTSISPSTNVPIKYDTVFYDYTGSFNLSTGVFTAPETGAYGVMGSIQISSGTGTVDYNRGGVQIGQAASITATNTGFSYATQIFLLANQTFNMDTTGASSTYSGKSGNTFSNTFSIFKISGSQGSSGGGPVIAMTSNKTSTGSITANASISGWTALADKTGSFDGTTYKVPESGLFFVNAGVKGNSASNAVLSINYNGTANSSSAFAASNVGLSVSNLIPCLAGDLITVSSSLTMGFSGAANENYFNVFKLSGSATVQAGEKTWAQYTGNAGTVLTAGVTNIDFVNKASASDSSWSGTIFTAPKSGWFDLKGAVYFSGTASIGLNLWTSAGSGSFSLKFRIAPSLSTSLNIFNTGTYLNAGDRAAIRADTNSTLLNDNQNHWISITSQ